MPMAGSVAATADQAAAVAATAVLVVLRGLGETEGAGGLVVATVMAAASSGRHRQRTGGTNTFGLRNKHMVATAAAASPAAKAGTAKVAGAGAETAGQADRAAGRAVARGAPVVATKVETVVVKVAVKVAGEAVRANSPVAVVRAGRQVEPAAAIRTRSSEWRPLPTVARKSAAQMSSCSRCWSRRRRASQRLCILRSPPDRQRALDRSDSRQC